MSDEPWTPILCNACLRERHLQRLRLSVGILAYVCPKHGPVLTAQLLHALGRGDDD